MEEILLNMGFQPDMMPADPNLTLARVTAVHRGRYQLFCESGETYGYLKTREYYEDGEIFPTVGDFVWIRRNDTGDSMVVHTLPRRTFFSRKEASTIPQEQIVAANFDYVFILQSMNQNFNIRRLERYLTLAWQSGGEPVIVLTKADLTEDPLSYVNAARQIAFDTPVLPVSVKSGLGVSSLQEYLQPGTTVVFLGSSGVGKSTLVNALAGLEVMSTSEVRADDARGRHTTTHRQLIPLPCGAMVIDTPGMRELGMWNVTEGLGASFVDVEQFLGQCRFRDCKHETEPGCRIREALASGELSEARWKSYLKLKKEARYTEGREAYLRNRTQKRKEAAVATHKGRA